jgi:hypothetical protein
MHFVAWHLPIGVSRGFRTGANALRLMVRRTTDPSDHASNRVMADALTNSRG